MTRAAVETRLPFGRVLEPPPPPLATATERYAVEHVLARGGMGDLFLARDQWLGRRVVLKEPRRDLDGFRNRVCELSIATEAAVLARLDHRYVITLLDVHERQGRQGLVLRHVDGCALDEIGLLGIPRLLTLARRIVEALDHVHGHGLVHLDLKLENVLLARDGTPCLIDFGIAQPPGRVHRPPGASGIVGTPQIMAPEQLADAEVTARADLYSLGVMLRELIAGRAVPAALDDLIGALLEADPARRPAGAREVLARLIRVSP